MFLRDLCLFLLMNLTLCAAVDIIVLRTRPVQNRFRMRAKCVYNVTEGMDAARFNILLNKPTTNFQSADLTSVWKAATSYRVETINPIQAPKFKVVFTVDYTGTDIPYGICSDLEQVTTELLQNSDMESDFQDNWFCHKDCTLKSSSDSYTGHYSVKVSNRSENWEGLSQNVDITPGARYSYSGYIKLLTLVGDAMYHTVELALSCKNSQTGDKKNVKFGHTIKVQKDIWTEIGAVLPVPEGYDTFKVYVIVYGKTAEYLADNMSLKHVPDIVDWKLKAEERIEVLRKANMSIRLTSDTALPSGLQIEVTQTKHEFPFGSLVDPTLIVDPDYIKYQDFFYDNFEWATIGNGIKWKQMEPVQGTFNFERPLNAINALRANGIPIRAHNVFWGEESKVQDWVLNLNKTALLQAMSDRITVQIGNMSGLLEHWAVNNENLHGDFYEHRTGDANITMQMFHDVHAVDENAKLFLNDYAIIETRGNQIATAVKEQARLFKTAGVPIYGIGLQSHIKSADLDITSMKTRLDKVAEAELPIWATEFSMEEENVTKKGMDISMNFGESLGLRENINMASGSFSAEALEDMLYLYFSHPATEGINLAGYWDGRIFEQSARLVEGPDMTPNAAGLAYQTLFKQTWRTLETRNITDENPVLLRGFKGNYTINVKQNGELLKSEFVILGSSGVTLNISLP